MRNENKILLKYFSNHVNKRFISKAESRCDINDI